MERKRKYRQSFFAAFVDFHKAFDSVDRAALWDILKVRGIPSRLLDIMAGLYTGTVSWRAVFWGLGLQFVLGIFIIRTDPGFEAFNWLGVQIQIDASALIAASVMAAPCALALSKLSYPETEESKFRCDGEIHIDAGNEQNLLEAASNGASSSIGLVANIAANLIAFLAVLEFINAALSWIGGMVDYPELTFQLICSYIFMPIAFMMGVSWNDSFLVAELIGTKLFLNEFVAYEKLSVFKNNRLAGMEEYINGEKQWISVRAETISTFALCGFANFSSIGIMLGGLSSIAPSRRSDIAQTVIRALFTGTCVSLVNACVAATDKVALLIGNLNYSHHPNLIAPVMDVHELAHLLQELNFRVVSLLDLTKQEMTAAILQYQQLLSKGVYGGRSTTFRLIARYNQEFNPSEIRPLEPLGNTVYGYATCEDAEAYEVQDGERSTGIFTKYLNKRILQEGKITHVLEQVLEDLGKDPLITGKQVMEIKHTLKEARSLTDSIRSVGYTMALAQRNLCWKNANDVPQKKEVKFVCGVEVELSFSALFSNVLIVFATIKKAAADTLDCSISLQSTPVLEDVFSNHSSQSDSFNSFQLQGGENADGILRLCGLQKLKRSMTIKVDLHYTEATSRHRLVVSKEEDIGKPLVAKCELHRHINVDKLPETGAKGASSASKSMGHMGPQQTPVPQAFRPSTRHAENIQKLLESHSSINCNEPEENDESDILDQRRVKH
ncbi:S28A1 protein, partial [Polypterus senegalus]